MVTGIKPKSDIEILRQKFNEWADDRIKECYACPPLSGSHDVQLRTKIQTLKFAKINLERIIKELFDGIPPA